MIDPSALSKQILLIDSTLQFQFFEQNTFTRLRDMVFNYKNFVRFLVKYLPCVITVVILQFCLDDIVWTKLCNASTLLYSYVFQNGDIIFSNTLIHNFKQMNYSTYFLWEGSFILDKCERFRRINYIRSNFM